MEHTTYAPHDIPRFLRQTTWPMIEDTEIYQTTKAIHETIRDSFGYCQEHQRFKIVQEQATRSSLSILNNFCEALGKGKGNTAQILMIARGEARECAASIAVGPPTWKELRPQILRVIEMIDQTITNIIPPGC